MDKLKGHFLDLFFNPASVAVIGASRNPIRMNYQLFANLVNLKFPGKIYPVNPNAEEILGIKAYPNLKDIEGDVDLAVVGVSAAATLDAIKDCVEKGVKGVVIVAGGFSEIGDKGRGMQDEISSLLRESGIRAIGPNTLSPINTSKNLAISFGSIESLNGGNLSFIFQSGFYEPRINWIFSEFNLHISKLVDLGNKMDINEVDALEYLAQDPETKVIAIHLESIGGNGREFMQLLKSTSRRKPIVVLKSGRTAAGVKAASSHSGALIKESDTVFDAALRQSGVIRAQTIGEFFDFAKAFEYLGPLNKNRIVVATLSGGEGVLTTDLCQQSGFSMAELSQSSFRKLKSIFPPWEIPINPFDLGVCAEFNRMDEVYNVVLDAMVSDQNMDCLAIQMMPIGLPDDVLKSFLKAKERKKHLVTWVPEPLCGKDKLIQWLETNRIPVYSSAEGAIKALSALYRYSIMQAAIY